MSGITLHAPEKRGANWVLRADVALGTDQLTLSARISPESLTWLEAAAKRGASWAQRWFDRLASRVGLSLAGDWSRFGVASTILQRLSSEALGSRVLTPYQALVDAVPLYQSHCGELGSEAQYAAELSLASIQEAASQGDDDAIEALGCLRTLHDVDVAIYRGQGFDLFRFCREQAPRDDRAMAMLQAMTALGRSCCDGPCEIVLDIEPYLVGIGGDVVGRASNQLALRSLGRHPSVSLSELDAYYRTLLSRYRGRGRGDVIGCAGGKCGDCGPSCACKKRDVISGSGSADCPCPPPSPSPSWCEMPCGPGERPGPRPGPRPIPMPTPIPPGTGVPGDVPPGTGIPGDVPPPGTGTPGDVPPGIGIPGDVPPGHLPPWDVPGPGTGTLGPDETAEIPGPGNVAISDRPPTFTPGGLGPFRPLDLHPSIREHLQQQQGGGGGGGGGLGPFRPLDIDPAIRDYLRRAGSGRS